MHRAERARQMRLDEARLEQVLESMPGGRRAAEAEARSAWEKACTEGSAVDDQEEEHPDRKRLEVPSSAAQQSSEEDAAEATALRHRHASGRRRSGSPLKHKKGPQPKPTREEAPHEGVETLTWYPENHVSHLAMAICDAKDALSSGGKENISFPANVTMLNFLDYLVVPTLVYELEYPRTTSYVRRVRVLFPCSPCHAVPVQDSAALRA